MGVWAIDGQKGNMPKPCQNVGAWNCDRVTIPPRFAWAKDDILANTIANTAYMPYITDVMPRAKGDRPQIVPKAAPI